MLKVVRVREVHWAYYEVEADTDEEALANFDGGEFTFSEFSHTEEDTAEIVDD